MRTLTPCRSPADFAAAVALTRDYLAWLDLDLSFQYPATEFARFPAMYGPPAGLFLLARSGEELAGGVGLRPLAAGVCEMKRLYVYDGFQGLGVGRRLCAALIAAAQGLGYRRMRLDTLGRMTAAIGRYRSLGFQEISAYRFNPDPTACCMELDLGPKAEKN